MCLHCSDTMGIVGAGGGGGCAGWWVNGGGCILHNVRAPEHSIDSMHSTITCTPENCQVTVVGKPLLSVVAL